MLSVQLLIIPSDGLEKVFTLSIELLDRNDMAPSFLIDFSQRTFDLCKASLTAGLNADLFLATDVDQGA